jgi:uncharacterized membrane protein YjjP (DUF1212 family)
MDTTLAVDAAAHGRARMTAISGDGTAVPYANGRAAFRAKVDLLSALGRSLHQVGLPAHLLEDALNETAQRCGTPVEVMSMPTGLWMSVADGDNLPATVLLRVQPGAVHLERLARLSRIVDRIGRGTLNPTEATAQIDSVMRAPPRWGKPAIVLAYLLSAAAFAVFFSGGVKEVVTAMLVGLAVGLISICVREGGVSRRMFELGAATAAAVIANVAYLTSETFAEWIPLASGLIILLPGLALVDAVEELAHGHLTSGSARLAGVGVVLLAMTFGAVLGLVIVPSATPNAPATTPDALPAWLLAPAVLAVAVGSTIRFRARLEDVWIALAASTIALAGARLGRDWLGDFAGPFMAAFLLGLAANLFANLSRQPPQLFTVPGLALLVPGSFGVQSMSALLSEDTIVGVDTAFHMFLAAMALVTGLLVSNSLYGNRRGC